jgi:hypothetical protein
MSGDAGELEGVEPTSNQICRPEKPAQQAFSEQSENFCASKAGVKVTAALGCQKSPLDFFDNLSQTASGRSGFPHL